MKIRQGFVSNSSSSSFIIGLCNLGKEPDQSILQKYHNNIIKFPVSSDVIIPYEIDITDTGLSLTSSNSGEVECKVENGDFVCYINTRGDEPLDDDYDNVDLSYFEESDVELYEFIIKNNGKAIYGGERDG
jgi:hypothetical protein